MPSTHPVKTVRPSRRLLALALLAVSALQPTARAGDPPPLKVENARVLAVPPVSQETAAFMVLVNPGDRPVRLVSFTTPIAGETTPMVTTHDMREGKMVMGMATVPALEIPAHGRRELKPGGDHLMLMSLKAAPKEGETVALTLRFAQPGPAEMTVQAPVVRDADAADASPAGHHHGH